MGCGDGDQILSELRDGNPVTLTKPNQLNDSAMVRVRPSQTVIRIEFRAIKYLGHSHMPVSIQKPALLLGEGLRGSAG